MKDKKIFILLFLIILLVACKKEKEINNYKLSFDSMYQNNYTLSDDKGNEIIRMNFFDDGTLASFEVTEKDRHFSVIFNFYNNSIHSYAVRDELSNYGSSTIFYPNEESKLFRMEQFEKTSVIEQILNDGNVIIQTSNSDDYMSEGTQE